MVASESPPAAPRTASREVRRRQLVEATIDSIARHGFSGTTMATVTGIAGLSMGIVSFHFQSKDNLLAETLMTLAEEHRDQWRQGIDRPGLSPTAKLLEIVDSHFHPEICTRRKLAVWFAFYGEARYRKAYRTKLTEIDTQRMEESERLCRRIIADGGYQGVDPARVAKSLEGLYDGLWLNILMYPEAFTPAESRSQVIGYLATVFPRHFPSAGGTAQ